MDFDSTPYWKICKLAPYNDHFKLIYNGYSGEEHIADISFNDGEWLFKEDAHYETLEDPAIKKFRDSLEYYVSFLNDNEEHRKFILEFQIGCSDINGNELKVYYLDENNEWQNKIWNFLKYDGFFEIYPPYAKSVDSPLFTDYITNIKRFSIEEPMNELLDWLLDDIRKECGNNFMFWIDL